MSRIILRRRQNRAANIIAGSLSALTNSNAINRYAKRIKWGSYKLQGVVRARKACITAQLALLTKKWDSLYAALPVSSPPEPVAPPESDSIRSTPPAAVAVAAASTSKRVARQRGGGGRNGSENPKGKGRAQRPGTAGKDSESNGIRRTSKMGVSRGKEDNDSTKTSLQDVHGAETRRSIHVSAEAKHEEIFIWLRRARSVHAKAVIDYERFTV